MKYWYVETNWSTEYECGGDVIAIYPENEEYKAKKVFAKVVAEEKQYAEDENYFVYEDTDDFFSAGEDGYYLTAHTEVMLKSLDMSSDYYADEENK